MGGTTTDPGELPLLLPVPMLLPVPDFCAPPLTRPPPPQPWLLLQRPPRYLLAPLLPPPASSHGSCATSGCAGRQMWSCLPVCVGAGAGAVPTGVCRGRGRGGAYQCV